MDIISCLLEDEHKRRRKWKKVAGWLENSTGICCGAVLFDLLFCLDTEAKSLVLQLVLVECLAVLFPRYEKRKG